MVPFDMEYPLVVAVKVRNKRRNRENESKTD